MKFLASVSLLATAASAVSVGLNKRESPLDIKLQMIGNTGVKATITNTGSASLKVFKTGTFLDSAPVEKVKVFQGKSKVAFGGVRLRVSTAQLQEEAFQTIAAGETVEADFDVGELHDLSVGGAFDIFSEGALSYAVGNSTKITGVVPFSTNLISAKVDGVEAAKVFSTFHAKRQAVQDDCTGTERTQTVNAIEACASLAQEASSVAQSDDAKLEEYFKNTDSSTRSYVVDVFDKIASECGSTTSGAAYYCSDVYGACSNGVLAYTLPSQDYMVNCPLFFSALEPTSSVCHDQDQQTTALHETTHLSEVAGTEDYNGYGYEFVQSLSAEQNLNHADTYTLFAQSIFANC
ncbi:neutral protease 2-like protein [Biscogniauxia mediterranea]|nr:neutral protease 2-like protein [Biscogniauxia mediterranea]